MDYSKFLQVYANIPEKLRSQIVVVVDEQPYSWSAVYLEMLNDTELSKKIFAKLVEMKMI